MADSFTFTVITKFSYKSEEYQKAVKWCEQNICKRYTDGATPDKWMILFSGEALDKTTREREKITEFKFKEQRDACLFALRWM